MPDSATRPPSRLSAGASEALADNPDCAGLIRALAAAPDAPRTRAAASVAPSVLAVLRGEPAGDRRVRTLLRRLLRPVPAAAAAAAAAAVAVFVLGSSRRPASDASPAVPQGAAVAVAPSSAAAEGGADASGVFFRADDLRSLGVSASRPEDLLAAQRPDGSWAPARGGESLAPAATGLAVLRLAASDAPGRDEALARAALWLRAQQNADGSFGSTVSPNVAAYNLALPAVALLRLYETGGYAELFTPIDGAVGSIRSRLAAGGDRLSRGDVWLASALALADRLEWTDSHSGDLRRALRRIDASGDARLAAVAGASSLAEKRDALIAFCDVRI